jgi:hypothetical protein
LFKYVISKLGSKRLLFEFIGFLFPQAWHSFSTETNEGFLPIGGHAVSKIPRVSLILITMAPFLYSLSFGDELARMTTPANPSNERVYGQWVLYDKGEVPFLSPEKARFGSTWYFTAPPKPISNQGFSMNPEISNTKESYAPTKIQKKELSNIENSEQSKENSCYHFGKINLLKTNLEPSLNFISSLSVTHYKEANPLSWTLEKINDTDIFKSLAIFLELKLKF